MFLNSNVVPVVLQPFDSGRIAATGNTENRVARRGLVFEADQAALTIPHISPLHLSDIRIENSSVVGGLTTVYREGQLIDDNGDDWAIMYNAPNPVDIAPVYVPRFDGRVEIWQDASLIKVTRPLKHKLGVGADRAGGGLRGVIREFSKGARWRMLKTLGKVRKDDVPAFCTLTYPADWPHEAQTWKRHLDNFFKRLRRRFPKSSAIWKLEPQRRGAPHYHLLVWGAAFQYFLAWAARAWYEVVGSRDEKHLAHGARVEQLRSWRGAVSYASKYLGKVISPEGDEAGNPWEYPGRWWGIFGREFLPWGELVIAFVGRVESIRLIRIMRKCMGIKGRDFASLSMLVNDATWWAARLPDLMGW